MDVYKNKASGSIAFIHSVHRTVRYSGAASTNIDNIHRTKQRDLPGLQKENKCRTLSKTFIAVIQYVEFGLLGVLIYQMMKITMPLCHNGTSWFNLCLAPPGNIGFLSVGLNL
jgi:hypothetical protein